ncbi:nuclear transport factor 2 family protein [Actinomadura madurae]|uniref:nuclear transport factor 2 family protein n=1 Tax=Actinomadura madurae TaxID=1993 RepID=UPI0020D238AE|nr:nuclear transport factor 2 family protein [Actinomadura madurae]MCP9976671.1 nuclear transport factor 2 family protein [Actinomadura madurae]MCQ0012862.1 nuclear transport factor 2 family protein [Actinomadura madurae]
MTRPAPASPREVFARLGEGISAGRWDELAALYAEDAVVEQPFAPPPAPPRLEGRATLDRHFRRAAPGRWSCASATWWCTTPPIRR